MINDGGPAFPTDSEHMSREAIEEAIEVLEDASAEMLMETGDKNYYIEAIAVLRQALVDADDTSQERVDEIVKDEHEPVAWRYKYPDGVWRFSNGERVNGSDPIKSQPLYTAPPKKQWVGLTDEEIHEVTSKKWWDWEDAFDIEGFSRAIEAKLKEKNA
jgi:hypothetical protein